MDTIATLQSLGLTLPSPAYIAGALLFSFIGIFAYYRGKRAGQGRTKWLGVALMFYPYAVSETWLLYLIGMALTVAAFGWKDSSQ